MTIGPSIVWSLACILTLSVHHHASATKTISSTQCLELILKSCRFCTMLSTPILLRVRSHFELASSVRFTRRHVFLLLILRPITHSENDTRTPEAQDLGCYKVNLNLFTYRVEYCRITNPNPESSPRLYYAIRANQQDKELFNSSSPSTFFTRPLYPSS